MPFDVMPYTDKMAYHGFVPLDHESPKYFDVQAKGGQIILTPVRIQRADAVRAKLAELDLQEQDIVDAVAWARASQPKPARKAR